MTLTLHLTDDLEQRLVDEANRLGLSPGQVALKAIAEHLAPSSRTAAVSLLQSWLDEGDAEEHRATGELLIQLLDEDRSSDRKFFPQENKGASW
jgi:hypothetical protein